MFRCKWLRSGPWRKIAVFVIVPWKGTYLQGFLFSHSTVKEVASGFASTKSSSQCKHQRPRNPVPCAVLPGAYPLVANPLRQHDILGFICRHTVLKGVERPTAESREKFTTVLLRVTTNFPMVVLALLIDFILFSDLYSCPPWEQALGGSQAQSKALLKSYPAI